MLTRYTLVLLDVAGQHKATIHSDDLTWLKAAADKWASSDKRHATRLSELHDVSTINAAKGITAALAPTKVPPAVRGVPKS